MEVEKIRVLAIPKESYWELIEKAEKAGIDKVFRMSFKTGGVYYVDIQTKGKKLNNDRSKFNRF